MTDVYCFAYVEDPPSAAVAHKLVATRNAQLNHRLVFRNGFPAVMRGYGNIKSKCEAFLNMARAGIHTFILTDLDTAECACALIRDWFAIPQGDPVTLPSQCILLCDFVDSLWMPERAAENSLSLDRALKALMKV